MDSTDGSFGSLLMATAADALASLQFGLTSPTKLHTASHPLTPEVEVEVEDGAADEGPLSPEVEVGDGAADEGADDLDGSVDATRAAQVEGKRPATRARNTGV